MSKERKNGRRNGERRKGINLEKRFSKILSKTYLEVNRDCPSIRCDNCPVENKNGDLLKKVTKPDCYVCDPKTKQGMYVEITNGNGNGKHKKAQRRVVEAAGVNNYFVLTGDHMNQLEEVDTAEEALVLVFDWFGGEMD